jgi:hypothetical protein
MFKLNRKEFENLRSQIATSSLRNNRIKTKFKSGGRRYLPHAFTENGVAMLSSVLRSKKAIKVNIEIMRTFTKLRHVLATNSEIKKKIMRIESKVEQNDQRFKALIEEIKRLFLKDTKKRKRKIGFKVN